MGARATVAVGFALMLSAISASLTSASFRTPERCGERDKDARWKS